MSQGWGAIHAVRRRDRARDDAWIRAYLRDAPFGFLATVAEGRPHIVPNLFVYDERSHAIYLHTARAGRTASNVAAGGPATFATARIGRVLPADTPLEFSVEHAGVVVFGECCAVEQRDDKANALQLILDKYAPHLRPGSDYRPVTPAEIDRTAVQCLCIEAWSGKALGAPPDFPGAFAVRECARNWFAP